MAATGRGVVVEETLNAVEDRRDRSDFKTFRVLELRMLSVATPRRGGENYGTHRRCAAWLGRLFRGLHTGFFLDGAFFLKEACR